MRSGQQIEKAPVVLHMVNHFIHIGCKTLLWKCGALVWGFYFILYSTYAQEKVTYQEHILPLIEANCSKCHNSDKKKADLDLTT